MAKSAGRRDRALRKKEDERKNEDLFFVDTQGDEGVRHSVLNEYANGESGAVPGRKRRGQSFAKPLKTDVILGNKSSTEGPPAKKQSTNKVKNGISAAERDSMNRIAKRAHQSRGLWDMPPGDKYAGDVAVSGAALSAGNRDLWSEGPSKESAQGPANVPEHDTPFNAPKKAPKTLHTPSVGPVLLEPTQLPKAVDAPEAGMSYNPALEDHEALLGKVHERYAHLEEQDEKIAELNEKGQTIARAALNDGLVEAASEDESSESESEHEREQGEPAKKTPRAKTRKDRKREKRNAAEVAAARERKWLKQKHHSVLASKNVTKKLRAEEEARRAAREAEKAKTLEAVAQKGLSQKRVGPLRVPEKTPEFQLSDELSESLRGLKPEGNLWKDWVSSNMKRGRIPMERSNLSRAMGLRQLGSHGHARGHNLKLVEKHAWKRFN